MRTPTRYQLHRMRVEMQTPPNWPGRRRNYGMEKTDDLSNFRLSNSEGDDKTYLVADSLRYGQSRGVVLIAEIKKHRPGSADRVCPDHVQDEVAARIVAALNKDKHEEG